MNCQSASARRNSDAACQAAGAGRRLEMIRESWRAEAPKATRRDGVDRVPKESERFDETLGEVLIEKYSHEVVSSFDWASSSRAPRTASSVSVGYARTISGIVMPAASDSRRNAIDMRVPSTRGLPQGVPDRPRSTSWCSSLHCPPDPLLRLDEGLEKGRPPRHLPAPRRRPAPELWQDLAPEQLDPRQDVVLPHPGPAHPHGGVGDAGLVLGEQGLDHLRG